MEKDTQKTVLLTILTSIILLIVTSIAYLIISSNNENNERYTLRSATISIVYTDCASNKQSDCANMTKNLSPGESFEKTFKVQNNGTIPVDYKIIFKELINTFQNGDLVYTIKDLSDNVLQSERSLPYASSQTTNVNAFLDTIAANTTKEFKIVVKFKEKAEDQENNLSASYAIKLGITKQNSGTDKIYNLVAGANPNSLDVITKTAPEGATCTNTLAYDGTSDNNLRYVGINPCNYVTFNNEPWRIIGVMNNIDNGTGKMETRIKLVRKDSLGSYSWDSSTSNSGRGVNNWEVADLNVELNGDYLNTSLNADTLWYNGENDAQNGVFDHTKVLNANAQNLIENAVYNLGGHSTNAVTSSDIYNIERGTTVYSGGNPRPTKWTGKIALMYPSDFGFAVGGSVRNTCLAKNLNAYLESNCYTNDWILHTSSYQWLLTPRTNYAYMAAVTRPSGTLNLNNCADAYAVKPSFYLKESVSIGSGDGSETNPYILT